ncbi:MAG: hypothetical protein ABSG17_19345 [Spirochaetia bacterium]|jgi:hypothetical protein
MSSLSEQASGDTYREAFLVGAVIAAVGAVFSFVAMRQAKGAKVTFNSNAGLGVSMEESRS